MKFPIHIPPLPDEVLTSWVLRLCGALKTKYHTFCDFTFGKVEADTRDLDLNITDEQIKRLKKLTFLTPAQIDGMLLRDYHPNLTADSTPRNWVLTKGSYHRTAKNNFTVFCSSCFSKDKIPYFRKRWRLVTSVFCTDCNLQLLDNCPKCEQSANFLRLDIGHKERVNEKKLCICHNCGFDLRKGKQIPCTPADIKLQNELNEYLSKGYTNDLIYSHLYFDVFILVLSLLNTRRKEVREFDAVVSEALGFEVQKPLDRGREIKNSTLETRITLIRKAHWFTGQSNDEIIELCRKSGIPACFIKHEKKETPFWFDSLIQEGLDLKYFQWKVAYPNYAHLSSYQRYVSARGHRE